MSGHIGIPPLGPQDLLPTVDVEGGIWNLVPVMSAHAVERIPHGTERDADRYFGDNWTKAFTFDRGQWKLLRPGVNPQCVDPSTGNSGDCGGPFTEPTPDTLNDAVQIGRGYWVFFTADGTLTPIP